ncbi:hypothetical protein DXG01_010462, partial [Tephrocybe rancida]
MIPHLKKKHLMKERPPTPSYTPSARPRNTLPTRGGKIPALIFLQHGQALAQNHYLPPRIHPAADPSPTTHPEEDNPFLDYNHIVDPPISRHRRKREAQWRNWNVLIPRLIGLYMEYTCSSKSLRETPPVPQRACTCGMPRRNIEIIVVHFDTPLEPTLAVDFKVLDFVSTLFLHIAPNNTGWTDTVESFLAKQGYKLAAEGSLRKWFGNALVWYNVLQDTTTRHVDQVLRIARCHAVKINDGIDISQEFEEGDPLLSPCARQSSPSPFFNENLSPELLRYISPPQSPQTPLQSPRTPHHHPTVEDDNDDDDIPIVGLKCGRHEEDVEETELSNPFPDPAAR